MSLYWKLHTSGSCQAPVGSSAICLTPGRSASQGPSAAGSQPKRNGSPLGSFHAPTNAWAVGYASGGINGKLCSMSSQPRIITTIPCAAIAAQTAPARRTK